MTPEELEEIRASCEKNLNRSIPNKEKNMTEDELKAIDWSKATIHLVMPQEVFTNKEKMDFLKMMKDIVFHQGYEMGRASAMEEIRKLKRHIRIMEEEKERS